MKTKDRAKEIFEYMANQLAEGVHIDTKRKKEMIKEIEFFIDND